jgi:DNA-directed RNA polymerase specialized sigma24 family protein
MMRNDGDAEDAVQEIFIDVWKNASRFDESRASETTFIAMIARRRFPWPIVSRPGSWGADS